jgi:hypothetical protein
MEDPPMAARYRRYRRHPLVWVGLILLTVSILVRWQLPRVLHVPIVAIQITGVVLQGLATAFLLLGIIKGARRAEQERSRES